MASIATAFPTAQSGMSYNPELTQFNPKKSKFNQDVFNPDEKLAWEKYLSLGRLLSEYRHASASTITEEVTEPKPDQLPKN